VSYATAEALRAALEHRLNRQADESQTPVDRLRRRVLFERVASRLQAAEPGRWVVKGGMALEMRLPDGARLTKDLDLGLRDLEIDPDDLRNRLIESLTADPAGDRFVMAVGPVKRLAADGRGHPTWRASVAAALAGRRFGAIKLDISPRAHELDMTEVMELPNSLAFAGVRTAQIEVIDVHRHAAEKLHAIQRTFSDRENTRMRDLVDIVILVEHGLLDPAKLGPAMSSVWEDREGVAPPRELREPPASWAASYAATAAELALGAGSVDEAVGVATTLWDQALGATGIDPPAA